ncbi:hypothetical protein EDD53_2162 [Pacificibacter maritimus]|uniref:HNH endonuclease n=1 Tax=Pacificibacter maritimus TaxID=762213 RepID=A0A3N4UH13_9RHOB|nr:hypothetical protein [Pacificibacter maritimus]RPE66459.1 hypothetical protein EDD53_2162 [Pacificibacter maritimus]
METQICEDDERSIDAFVEIEENSLTLQSRGGTKGTDRAKNTDYSRGLRLLLKRLHEQDCDFLEAFVDSSRVQGLSLDDRRVLSVEEIDNTPTEQLFTLVSKRMQAVGKVDKTKLHTGNANKRLKFSFFEATVEDLLELTKRRPGDHGIRRRSHLSSTEQIWTEGKPVLVSHLRRERSRGLARAKKEAFIRENGKLFCERCKLDPVAHYSDPVAEACIEVHHSVTEVANMLEGHMTQLEDLECLCANCHRLVHAILKRDALRS